MTTRPIRALAVALLAVATLSGCFRFDMRVQVGEDDTVSGSYVVAVDRSVLEMTGQDVDELLGTGADGPSGLLGEDGGVQVREEPYEDEDAVGRQYVFDAVPFAVFNGEGMTLAHADGRYTLDGTLPASTGDTDLGMSVQADIRIAFTFPGDVEETNGQVDPDDPRTVSWTGDGTQDLVLQAVASEAGAPWLGLAVAGGAGLLLAGGVVALVVVLVRRRRRRAAAAPPGWYPPGGAGGPAAPAAPAAWPTDGAPRTPLAWTPDPAPGVPPGAVPRQPPPGLPPYGG